MTAGYREALETALVAAAPVALHDALERSGLLTGALR